MVNELSGMNRRIGLQGLPAPGTTPWSTLGRAAAHNANLIRIDIPGPRRFPTPAAPLPPAPDIGALIDDHWVRERR